MYEVGQWVYCVEFGATEEPEEVSGYLFLAECNDCIFCVPEYASCRGDMDAQLEEMYKESTEDFGADGIVIAKKEHVFPSLEEAEEWIEIKKKGEHASGE